MSDLKPCHCGGNAVKTIEGLDERFGYANKVTIHCVSCGIRLSRMGDTSKGGYADNSRVEAVATEAWNRRATPPVSGDIAALVAWLNLAVGAGGTRNTVQLRTAATSLAALHERVVELETALAAERTARRIASLGLAQAAREKDSARESREFWRAAAEEEHAARAAAEARAAELESAIAAEQTASYCYEQLATELKAKLAEARTALEPFANWPTLEAYDDTDYEGDMPFKAGDFRRARTVHASI